MLTTSEGRGVDTFEFRYNEENVIGVCGNGYTYSGCAYKKNRSRKSNAKVAKWFGKATMLLHGLSSSLPLTSAFSNCNIQEHLLEHATSGSFRQKGYHQHTIRRPITSNALMISKESQHRYYFQQRMSSIENDSNDNHYVQKIHSWLQSQLPPPPQDQLSCSGDIGSIFLYTFLDHTINSMYDEWLNSPEVLVSASASAAMETSFAASSELANSITQTPITGNSFPVWFDLSNSAPFGNIPLSSALPIAHHIQYAPALDTAGMASVLLASTWLVCGYFTGAFDFKNTLECTANKAIIVTAKNWFFTCLIMLTIAYGSDILVGFIDGLHKSVGLTKADEDYVLDSLTVLLAWRFTLNNFFGYDNDGSDGK